MPIVRVGYRRKVRDLSIPNTSEIITRPLCCATAHPSIAESEVKRWHHLSVGRRGLSERPSMAFRREAVARRYYFAVPEVVTACRGERTHRYPKDREPQERRPIQR